MENVWFFDDELFDLFFDLQPVFVVVFVLGVNEPLVDLYAVFVAEIEFFDFLYVEQHGGTGGDSVAFALDHDVKVGGAFAGDESSS